MVLIHVKALGLSMINGVRQVGIAASNLIRSPRLSFPPPPPSSSDESSDEAEAEVDDSATTSGVEPPSSPPLDLNEATPEPDGGGNGGIVAEEVIDDSLDISDDDARAATADNDLVSRGGLDLARLDSTNNGILLPTIGTSAAGNNNATASGSGGDDELMELVANAPPRDVLGPCYNSDVLGTVGQHKGLQCHLCGKLYVHKGNLKYHLLVVHAAFRCFYPSCSAEFSSHDGLKKHESEAHDIDIHRAYALNRVTRFKAGKLKPVLRYGEWEYALLKKLTRSERGLMANANANDNDGCLIQSDVGPVHRSNIGQVGQQRRYSAPATAPLNDEPQPGTSASFLAAAASASASASLDDEPQPGTSASFLASAAATSASATSSQMDTEIPDLTAAGTASLISTVASNGDFTNNNEGVGVGIGDIVPVQETRKIFLCTLPSCSKVFGTTRGRSMHECRSHGPQLRSYVCSTCTHGFKIKADLERHAKKMGHHGHAQQQAQAQRPATSSSSLIGSARSASNDDSGCSTSSPFHTFVSAPQSAT